MDGGMVRHQRSRGERAGDAAAQSFQAMVRGARDRKSDESYPLWPGAAGQAAYGAQGQQGRALRKGIRLRTSGMFGAEDAPDARSASPAAAAGRSEEHTSELQSLMRISYS